MVTLNKSGNREFQQPGQQADFSNVPTEQLEEILRNRKNKEAEPVVEQSEDGQPFAGASGGTANEQALSEVRHDIASGSPVAETQGRQVEGVTEADIAAAINGDKTHDSLLIDIQKKGSPKQALETLLDLASGSQNKE